MCRDRLCQKKAWACPLRGRALVRPRGRTRATRSRAAPPFGSRSLTQASTRPVRAKNRQARQQAKQAASVPCVCSPVSPRREARPTSLPGSDQPGTARPASRLRPAPAGKAKPRPSQAPSGPRPPQPSLARSQASGIDPIPAGWSKGPHDGATPGNRHLTGRGVSEILCCAQYSGCRTALGGSPKNNHEEIENTPVIPITLSRLC